MKKKVSKKIAIFRASVISSVCFAMSPLWAGLFFILPITVLIILRYSRMDVIYDHSKPYSTSDQFDRTLMGCHTFSARKKIYGY